MADLLEAKEEEASSLERRKTRLLQKGVLPLDEEAASASGGSSVLTDDALWKVLNEDRSVSTSVHVGVEGEWLWVAQPGDVLYLAARKVREAGGQLLVETVDGRSLTVSPDAVAQRILDTSLLKRHVPDLTRLDEVTEASVLHNLRQRFAADVIYTSLGSILISINPFKWMPRIYAADVLNAYVEPRSGGDPLPPHVFDVAGQCYRGLEGGAGSQSILISGESGAGKTEATKKCLQFLATVARSGSDVDKRILAANPVLEAFGNAKTVRNDNSSRFGKWLQVQFDSSHAICGCSIVNYLLEKSRVVSLGRGERNYHIFYQLTRGASDSQRAALHLGRPDDYVYLNQSDVMDVAGESDVDNFEDLEESLENLGFSDDEVDALFRVLAAILHMGNITFAESDGGAAVSNADALAKVAELLAVDSDALSAGFCFQTFVVRGEQMKKTFTAEQARTVRDAVCKHLYGNMFDWIVKRVNEAVNPGARKAHAGFIGILDIFGFEVFEHNSLEQLCINFANEKLQQQFNNVVLGEEQESLLREGVDWTHIDFDDNQPVLDAIEKKPWGLMPSLDDEIRVPKTTDPKWLGKYLSRLTSKTEVWQPPKVRVEEFLVRHFAGEVKYDCAGFLEKNKDRLQADIAELLQASTDSFVAALIPKEDDASSSGAGSRKARRTLTRHFSTQLRHLIGSIAETKPHYIRCVKPNEAKTNGIFSAPLVAQQLRYGGVLQCINIYKKGYPFRRTHADFAESYWFLVPGNRTAAPRDACARIIDVLRPEHSELETCVLGVTQVLYRFNSHLVFEKLRTAAFTAGAARLQRVYRGHQGRQRAAVLSAARDGIRTASAARQLEPLRAAVAHAQSLHFVIQDVKPALALIGRLEEEQALRERVAELLDLNILEHYRELRQLLVRAEELDMMDDATIQAGVTKESQSSKLIDIQSKLDTAEQTGDRALLESALTAAEALPDDLREVVSLSEKKARLLLDELRREEKLAAQLAGLLEDGAGVVAGEVGELPLDGVDASVFDHVLMAMASQRIRSAHAQQLRRTAELLRDARTLLLAGDWLELDDLLTEAAGSKQQAADVAAAELALLRAEVDNRNTLRLLGGLLQRGDCVRGADGAIRMDDIDTAELEEALATLAEEDTPTAGARRIVACGRLLLRLRRYVLDGDWTAVATTLQEAASSDDGRALLEVEAAAAELAVLRDEVSDLKQAADLRAAVASGAVVYDTETSDTSYILLEELDRATAYAAAQRWRKLRTQRLLDSAVYLRSVRAAVRDGDYDAVGALLLEQPLELAEEVRGELAEVLRKQQSAAYEDMLREGLRTGALRPTAGSNDVDVDRVDAEQLEAAVLSVRELPFAKSRAMLLLESSAAFVLQLRQLLLRVGFGPHLQKLLAQAPAPLDDQAVEEVTDIGATLDNFLLEAELARELNGAADTLERKALSDLLSRWRALKFHTPPVAHLGYVASRVYELRRARALADWEHAERIIILLDASNDFGAYTDLVVREVTLARREMRSARVLAKARDALAEGAAAPHERRRDELSLELCSTAGLQALLAEHRAQLKETVLGRELVQCVELLSLLRRSLLDANWPRVAKCLEMFAVLPHLPVCGEEVAAVRRVDVFRKRTDALLAALSRGGPSGPVGQLDVSAVETVPLADALLALETVGGDDSEVRAALTVGTAVLRLRRCLLGGSRSELRELCESLHGQVEPLFSRQAYSFTSKPQSSTLQRCVRVAAAEFSAVADEANDWSFQLALRSALSTGAPPRQVGLVDAAIIQLSPLEETVAAVLAGGPRSAEAVSLLFSAHVVLCIRRGWKADDWEAVRLAVKDALRWGVSDLAAEEVETAKLEVQFRHLVDGLGMPWASGLALLQSTGSVPAFKADMQARMDAAAAALEAIDQEAALAAMAALREVGADVPIMRLLGKLLAMSEDNVLQLQLKAALTGGELDAIVRTTMAIKQRFLAKLPDELFALSSYPKLRSPLDVSAEVGIPVTRLQATLLAHSPATLQTSLLALPRELLPSALSAFKWLLAIMGDRQHPAPLNLAQQLVRVGLGEERLRDEIYCQIMKQLTRNASPHSTARGWRLLQLCLGSFPPSEGFENYVESFLRKHDRLSLVRLMHEIVYLGARPRPPSMEEVVNVCGLPDDSGAAGDAASDGSAAAGSATGVLPPLPDDSRSDTATAVAEALSVTPELSAGSFGKLSTSTYDEIEALSSSSFSLLPPSFSTAAAGSDAAAAAAAAADGGGAAGDGDASSSALKLAVDDLDLASLNLHVDDLLRPSALLPTRPAFTPTSAAALSAATAAAAAAARSAASAEPALSSSSVAAASSAAAAATAASPAAATAAAAGTAPSSASSSSITLGGDGGMTMPTLHSAPALAGMDDDYDPSPFDALVMGGDSLRGAAFAGLSSLTSASTTPSSAAAASAALGTGLGAAGPPKSARSLADQLRSSRTTAPATTAPAMRKSSSAAPTSRAYASLLAPTRRPAHTAPPASPPGHSSHSSTASFTLV